MLARARRLAAAPRRVAAALLCAGSVAPAAAELPEGTLPAVEVVGTAPLPGLELPREQVPSAVQTATDADLQRLHVTDLAQYLARAVGGVTINETQGNPFQPDLSYHGFTASPLLGTPQGLSVYLDGVRMNQPFGDVVSWDLLPPRAALSSLTLMPGSNPVFGLNTLGGALAVQTKDGLRHPGASLQLSGGSFGRAAAEFELGGSDAQSGLHGYLAGHRLHERGWRAASPSELRQLFAKVGRSTREGSVALAAALADNDLTGNGLQEAGALRRDWRSVRTTPDTTAQRASFLNLSGTRVLGDAWLLSANAYHRHVRTRTLNGDLNDEAADQSIYQPDGPEREALAAAGYGGIPPRGASAANTPFPRWRCIANALLNSEPNEKCNGLLNRSDTRQRSHGFAAQLAGQFEAAGVQHQLTAGLAYDASRVHFGQSTQFGYIRPDRSVAPVFGVGAFADGTQDSEDAFDARVALSARGRTGSLYLSDTLALGPRTHLTLSGRFNHTVMRMRDHLHPGGGAGSLDGQHRFARFNPAAGLSFVPSEALTLYAGLSQGSRAPSAVELGCADPASPCKLPNAFAGDPPLKQVVATTVEAGLRARPGPNLSWSAGVFRSDNRDDLLFVASDASGFGYFRNFGKTRRQGIELALTTEPAKGLSLSGHLLLLDATYRSAELVNGAGNSSSDRAMAGFPGTGGNIRVRPGDRIPMLPRRVLKLQLDYAPGARWHIGLDLTAASGAPLRGNENGLHRPDGLYYTGAGRTAGYAVLNLGLDYQPKPGLKFFVQVQNLFDRRYATGGQLGLDAFSPAGGFVARGLPRNAHGEYPVRNASLLSPGAPRAVWVGVRYAFGS